MAWLTTPSIWYRRKPKLIRGSTAGDQTNYQLKLTIYKGSGTDTINTVYLGGYVNNDFSDLRFTSSDETTLLSYWIESYISGVSAIVWVKIDSIPADPFSKTIYIYYDNLVASPGSNGTNTFDAFSDGTSLIGWNSNGASISAGTIVLAASGSGANYITSTNLVTRPLVAQYDVTVPAYYSMHGFWTNSGVQNSVENPNIGFYDAGDNNRYTSTGDGVTQGYSNAGARTTTKHTLKVIWGNTLADTKYYIDGVQKTSPAGNFPSATSLYFSISGSSGYTMPQTTIDNIIVRKYASPEPTFDATSPEQIYTANLTVSSIPTGAEIWINNVDQGVITTSWFILNPGIYTVMLTKPGYEDYIEIITLSSNQNAIVQGNLISSTGNLDISSTPSGAKIFLAPTGSPLVYQGIDTPNTISLSPLTYDYKLTLTDYYDATGSFTIIAGSTTTLNIPLIRLPCTITPKYSGDTVTLSMTPIQGVAPYTIQFRMSPVQSMGNDASAATEVIPDIRIPGGNNISGVSEGVVITRVYTLDGADLEGATTKVGDTGPSIIFAAETIDSCTPPQSCVKYCKVFVGCTAPVCDFTVT